MKMKQIMIILFSSLPQSACSEPAVFCTGLGLPKFCNRAQCVQLSALPQPKISDGSHEVGVKGYEPQKTFTWYMSAESAGCFQRHKCNCCDTAELSL